MKPKKLAFIADIHGTLPALEATLQHIQKHPVDEIIIAGDFIGGPQPKQVLAKLHQLPCRLILGNGENNLLMMAHDRAPDYWWTHRQFDSARWFYDQLDKADIQFLDSLPEQLVIDYEGHAPIRVVHGTPWDINKLLFPDREPQALTRALAMIPEPVLVFAHTHLPNIYYENGKMALNPGSAGNNLHGKPSISYATLTWRNEAWHPEIHFIKYDLTQTKEIFYESGFLAATRPLGRGFLESVLTGKNSAYAFIQHAFQKAKEAGYENIQVVPDEIWLQAEETFNWTLDL